MILLLRLSPRRGAFASQPTRPTRSLGIYHDPHALAETRCYFSLES